MNSQTHGAELGVVQLIELFDRFTAGETPARYVLAELSDDEREYLSYEQERLFHRLADEFATRALDYLIERGTDNAGSTASPGMLFLQAAQAATERWRLLGVPRGHITDHDLWAVTRAADAAMTWANIVLGHIETTRRYVKIGGAW